MKKTFSLIISILIPALFFAGCAMQKEIVYKDSRNWAILPGKSIPETEFDLFYVYPTLSASREKTFMDWENDPKLNRKAVEFAKAQTSIFGPGARVFAPFVRQLEFGRCIPILELREKVDPEKTDLKTGMSDTKKAFLHYLAEYNPEGRPFILFGHSQGAMDLYTLLKNTPEITMERGFVAAYLAGLPRITPEKVKRDFAGRDIALAHHADDSGVLVIWNTQNKEVVNSIFTGNGTCCINLLNWKTDGTPAPKELNRETVFYNYKTKQIKRVRNLTGATLDPVKGALIVDLPSNSEWDSRGIMGKGVFHTADVWLFAGNLRDNAKVRVNAWKKKFGKKKHSVEKIQIK